MMVRCIQLRYPASRRALSQMYCLEASGRSDPKQPLLTLCVSQLCQVKLLPRGGEPSSSKTSWLAVVLTCKEFKWRRHANTRTQWKRHANTHQVEHTHTEWYGHHKNESLSPTTPAPSHSQNRSHVKVLPQYAIQQGPMRSHGPDVNHLETEKKHKHQTMDVLGRFAKSGLDGALH